MIPRKVSKKALGVSRKERSITSRVSRMLFIQQLTQFVKQFKEVLMTLIYLRKLNDKVFSDNVREKVPRLGFLFLFLLLFDKVLVFRVSIALSMGVLLVFYNDNKNNK